MKRVARTYRNLEELFGLYAERKDAIRQRLGDFAAVPRSGYFYELAYCLLTPQSSAANATKAVELLKNADFFGAGGNPASLLRQADSYIRFHNTKGKRLLEARESFSGIMAYLCNGSTSAELRAWLAANVKGLGWKEASHFLRNIGHGNLAILDRHILKNLQYHGVIRSIPATLTPARYTRIEGRFRLFANSIGIPMDELDLLFWSKETGEILK